MLTKLDLMDAGTHALDILTGRVYPLKLGFIGVVNRSQQDINGNVSMLAARNAEAEFFRSHPAYRNIAHRCGTKYLAKTLNQVSCLLMDATFAPVLTCRFYVRRFSWPTFATNCQT